MFSMPIGRLFAPSEAARCPARFSAVMERRVRRLLNRPEGATLDEIADDLGLSPSEIRDFLDGPLRRALGHKVPSRVVLGLVRVYRLPEPYAS